LNVFGVISDSLGGAVSLCQKSQQLHGNIQCHYPPDGDIVSKTNLPEQPFLISIDEGSSVCLSNYKPYSETK